MKIAFRAHGVSTAEPAVMPLKEETLKAANPFVERLHAMPFIEMTGK
ncbi:hypothetical protein BTK96_005210 [Burkholderia pyrrocinia]|nr:hypothetical protein [Burkholderia pyrrocinia]EKS9896205.1 hypothetical protein [Burkholderia pyrrocinia]EKS9908242.1 hypothetical protein [Burkholderia pyrrocinia]